MVSASSTIESAEELYNNFEVEVKESGGLVNIVIEKQHLMEETT